MEEDTEVNILFQCASGEISNISIKDDINQSYVSNSGCEAETKDGSKVIVKLDNIKKITVYLGDQQVAAVVRGKISKRNLEKAVKKIAEEATE